MYHKRIAMQYEPAKTELCSHPAGMPFWVLLSEAGVMLSIAYVLAQLLGG